MYHKQVHCHGMQTGHGCNVRGSMSASRWQTCHYLADQVWNFGFWIFPFTPRLMAHWETFTFYIQCFRISLIMNFPLTNLQAIQRPTVHCYLPRLQPQFSFIPITANVTRDLSLWVVFLNNDFFLKNLTAFLIICFMHGCVCTSPPTSWGERTDTGAGFLLPTMWVLGLGSGHQAWQQVLLPFELACQTDISWPLGLVLSVVTQFSTELRTWPIWIWNICFQTAMVPRKILAL